MTCDVENKKKKKRKKEKKKETPTPAPAPAPRFTDTRTYKCLQISLLKGHRQDDLPTQEKAF